MAADIRSLKEGKQPRNAIEMAVLVAYYAAHVLAEGSRVDSIGTDELKKFFIQANYPLPSQRRMVLFKAKEAGYLDNRTHGKYALNAVGHNLVVHGLPSRSDSDVASRAHRKKSSGHGGGGKRSKPHGRRGK
jgi:hypothetical protein